MFKVIPQRTCIGCRSQKPKEQLVRITINKQGEMTIDLKKNLAGRGAYLCRSKTGKEKINKNCLKQAIKRNSFNYAFKKKIKSINSFASSDCGDIGSC